MPNSSALSATAKWLLKLALISCLPGGVMGGIFLAGAGTGLVLKELASAWPGEWSDFVDSYAMEFTDLFLHGGQVLAYREMQETGSAYDAAMCFTMATASIGLAYWRHHREPASHQRRHLAP